MALHRFGLLLLTLLVVPCALAVEVAALTSPAYPGAFISGVTPSRVSSAGGDVLAIAGGNFRAPLRVFFDLGGGTTPVEVTPIFPTTTMFYVVTPKVDAGPYGSRSASVVVLTYAGTSHESRTTAANSVQFLEADVAPHVIAVVPDAASSSAVARLTFFGDGFRAPVQLFAVHADGSESEMQVISVSLDAVQARLPPGRAEEHLGFRIVNAGNGKSTTLPDAFHYTAPMSVTSVYPSSGPYSGGTRVTIDGNGFAYAFGGFLEAVVIGGMAAQPVEANDQRIVVVTSPVQDPQCSDHAGEVVVTRSDTGEMVTAAPFTYVTPHAEFVSLPSSVLLGTPLDVTVRDTSDVTLFYLDGRRLEYDGDVKNDNGTTTYRLRIPADLEFPMHGCRALPLVASLRVTDMRTGCSASRALTVRPLQNSDPCRQPRHP